jgi:hypothetical protein
MRSGLIDLFVPDERDRRALEETLADWRAERAQQSGPGLLMTDARGLVASLRVIAGCVAAPYARGDVWRYLFWSLAAATGIGLLINIELLFRWPFGWSTSTQVWLAIVPSSASLALAFTGAAGFGLRRFERVPLLAAFIGLLTVLVLLQGWIVPEANQRFRETVLTELNGRVPLPVRGAAELTLPMLVTSISSSDEQERTRAGLIVIRKAALLSLCLSLVGFGEVIRRRLPEGWRWWAVQNLSGLAALVAAAGIVNAISPPLRWLQGPVELSVPTSAASWFVASGIVLLLTAWLARRTAEPPHQNPHPGTAARLRQGSGEVSPKR